MGFLDSPTSQFMTSQFYQDYQYYKGIIQYCIDNANRASCDSAELALLIANLTGLRDDYDNMMHLYADVMYGMYQTLSSTAQCVINAIDSPVLYNLQESMSNSINNMLNSSPYSDIHNQITNIKQAIDDSLPCDQVNNLTNTARSTVNNLINKANEMTNALNRFDSLMEKINKGLTKIANAANCLRAGGSSIATYTYMFAPDYYDAIQAVVDTSGNVGQKVNIGIQTLKTAINLDNELTYIANSLTI